MKMNKFSFKFRWIIMFTAFVLLVYGGRFLTLSSNVAIPVFNCPYNLDVVIEASCLYITEWTDYLLENNILSGIGKLLLIYGGTFLSILLLGRLWCGYVCPFGFIQEVLYKIREFVGLSSLKLTQKHKEYLNLVKYVLLTIFIIGLGFCEICPVRFVIPPLNGVATRIEIGIISSIIVLGIALFSERFFCKICPLGAFIGLFHKLTPWRIKKNCTSCTKCGICYEVCPMDIKDIYTQRKDSDVTSSDCIFCNKCIDNCPEKDALSLTFANKKICTSSRKKYYKNNL